MCREQKSIGMSMQARPECFHVSRDSVRAACVTTFVPSRKEEISQRDTAISYCQY
jgi:hypothetical protein